MLPASAPQLPSDAALDITGQRCPMTFVRVRLALDRLAPGQILQVTLSGAEPRQNVPATATLQGHAILGSTEPDEGDVSRLWIRKAGTPA